MYSLTKIVLFSMLLAVSSTELESNNLNGTCAIILSYNNHCSNDSTCQTCFICNDEKRCQCDKEQPSKIVCDNDAQVSTILACNCVTYDSESKSTHIGSCFYNCHNTIHLPKNPEDLINNSVCTSFHLTGLLCGDCKKGYSPLVFSVVWSIQMGTKTGGYLSWLDLCLSRYSIPSSLPLMLM